MDVVESKQSNRENQAGQEESPDDTYAELDLDTYHDNHIYDVSA
jgi:hypothetical protein